MKKLSIIVPVYNTEKYLNQCLNSLIHQDFLNYEIVIVNDESPDHSQDIIDAYQKQYPKLISSYIKKNGGLGDARNYGINVSQGDYLMFIDSDDYLKENCLSEMMNKIEDENLDILVFDFIKVYQDRSIHEISLTSDKLEDYILSTPNACNKIFKKSLFIDNNMYFTPHMWYEDLALIPGFAKVHPKIGYINKGYYFYKFRENSIMNPTQYDARILDYRKVFDLLSKHLKQDFYKELEYLSILHQYYGASLKLIPLHKYKELGKCLNSHEETFPNSFQNIYYRQKPFLFKFYCFCLEHHYYKICQALIFIRKKMKL